MHPVLLKYSRVRATIIGPSLPDYFQGQKWHKTKDKNENLHPFPINSKTRCISTISAFYFGNRSTDKFFQYG